MKIGKNKLINIIESTIKEILTEHRYDFSPTPYNSRTNRDVNLGTNPLSVDNGGHSNNDVLSQVSTIDNNGANFKSDNNVTLSPNKFIIYKIKNFGNDTIPSTMSLFGSGVYGEKNLRNAIDNLNGAARRNGKNVVYRTITSDMSKDKAAKSGYMIDTFWEFSLDNGQTWNILQPKPVENIKQSKLK